MLPSTGHQLCMVGKQIIKKAEVIEPRKPKVEKESR